MRTRRETARKILKNFRTRNKPLERGQLDLGDVEQSVLQEATPYHHKYSTHRPLSSSFLGLPYRILNINHKQELLRGLWGSPNSKTSLNPKPTIRSLKPRIPPCLPRPSETSANSPKSETVGLRLIPTNGISYTTTVFLQILTSADVPSLLSAGATAQ